MKPMLASTFDHSVGPVGATVVCAATGFAAGVRLRVQPVVIRQVAGRGAVTSGSIEASIAPYRGFRLGSGP